VTGAHHVVAGTRRALVLSGSIGSGHDSVAEACAATLRSRDVDTEILDAIALLGAGGSRVGEAVFRTIIKVPPLYDALHFSQLRAGTALAARADQASASRLVPRLRAMTADSGAGLLVSAFATGAGALGRLRAGAPESTPPVVVVCTDATAHRMWVHPGVDRYVVCSTMAAGTVRQYLPDADVVIVPPPVRPAFFDAPTRHEARAELSIGDTETCVLLVAGGWGLAPLVGGADALAAAGHRVVAVAGNNRRLEAKLRALDRHGGGRRRGTVTVFGWTDRMPELMAASDVVVTTPGQTCHEARVVGRPLVVLDVVPGHGRENLLLELERGGVVASTPYAAAVTAAVTAAADIAGDLEPWPILAPPAWDTRFWKTVEDLVGW
jgi:UDP-N-acetylglucosamine:LPS N-acetylglucosamine transferase